MLARGLVLLVLVLPAAAQPARRNVILLCKTQLLKDGKAYAEFCRKHAATGRSQLRRETIAALKRIAAREQPKVLKALGNPSGAQTLWLVNAIAVALTTEEIERAGKHVRAVFDSQPVRAGGDPGTVSAVLKPRKREPFARKGKKIPWNLKLLHVPEVWKQLQVTGEGAVVAMMDMGINYMHTDLRDNMWINAGEVPNNGRDDDGNGYVDDLYGFNFAAGRAEVRARGGFQHGTWTSSVVAGDGTGGTVTGVAPRARLMGLVATGGAFVVGKGFQYALRNGADIVNMSFSRPGLGQARGLWRLMAEQASCAGLVLVSGAGNFPGQPIPVQIRIPEGIPCVICAGGVTGKKRFARFTSQGPVEWKSVDLYGDYPMPRGLVKPDVCAFPGPRIALVSTGDSGYLPENNRRRGNSLSSPHVAGVCALMLSANPELTPWKVKEILERTATDLPPRGKDVRTGAGLVHALKAVRAARGGA